MFVWIIRLYKSLGEVVGRGTLFERIASFKIHSAGKEEGVAFISWEYT